MNTILRTSTAWFAIFLIAGLGAGPAEGIEITHIEATNVTTSTFTVFWQGSEAATPSLSVYADPDGFGDITDSVRVEFFPLATGDLTLPHEYADRGNRRLLEESLRENGLLLARVSLCDPATDYYVRVGALSAANELVEAPAGDLLPVRTAAETAFVHESLQIMVEFPEGNADGMVATLATPAAAYSLAWSVGDSGFSNRAIFNLTDLLDPGTNTNLQPEGALPLVIRLYRPDVTPETDDDDSLEFTAVFVVANVTDLIFSGGDTPRVVRGFAFSEIGTQTAGIPFRVTIRAVDALGNPVTDFAGPAELSASGAMDLGGGPTPAFIDGALTDYLVALEDHGQHHLEASLPDGSATGSSEPFRVATSYDRWIAAQFPNPEDRENPLLTARDADPWNTGVGNLLAYAFDTDPQNPDRTRLPRPILHFLENPAAGEPISNLDGPQPQGAVEDDAYLAITYARSKGATDLAFIPEVSADVVTWRSGASFTEEVAVQDFGDYELVTARDRTPYDQEGRRFMRLRVRSEESFSAWQARHFTGDLYSDPEWSGPAASPGGDGVVNLIKYALELDPFTFERNRLPKMSITTVGGEKFLVLNYVRPKNLPDVDYIVEASTDLINWYSGPGYIRTTTFNDPGNYQQVVARDLTPLDDERRFIRLRVARQ